MCNITGFQWQWFWGKWNGSAGQGGGTLELQMMYIISWISISRCGIKAESSQTASPLKHSVNVAVNLSHPKTVLRHTLVQKHHLPMLDVGRILYALLQSSYDRTYIRHWLICKGLIKYSLSVSRLGLQACSRSLAIHKVTSGRYHRL